MLHDLPMGRPWLCSGTDAITLRTWTLRDMQAPAVALPNGARWRALGYATAAAPLAVSGPRGVACVVAGVQRALLVDLEEDEEAGDDEDDDAVLGED